MKISEQSAEILSDISNHAEKELRLIEKAGRTCYKSESKDFETCKAFIRGIISRGHESVLEHSLLTVKFITSRSISHQLVRHRLCAFSQESQRYCNYGLDRFDNGVVFIKPVGISDGEFKMWQKACLFSEIEYMRALTAGQKPESARAVLPNCTKTELIMSANYREWRHVLKERTSPVADPNMRELMRGLLFELHTRIPVVFDDIGGNE